MKLDRIIAGIIALIPAGALAGCSPAELEGVGSGGGGGAGQGDTTGTVTGSGTSMAPSSGGDGQGGQGGQTAQGFGYQGVEVSLTSGAKVKGQLVGQYDHSHWWVNASKEKTLAVFDSAKYADYPNDHSITFLSSLDVDKTKDVPLPKGTVLYRDLLRQQGIVISQLPVDGPLYVGNGNSGYHLDENGYGNFAWDLGKKGPDGLDFKGDGTKNEDYLIWDAPITLPLGGYVVEVIRDAPDNPVPGEYSETADNNMIGIQVAGQFYLYLLHMRQGSIPDSVKPGAILEKGAYVGRVGNSGASMEPHLHITLMWYDDMTKRAWGVPSEWAGVWSKSSENAPAQKNDYLVPTTGTWISSSMF
jgi:hypothetical protein